MANKKRRSDIATYPSPMQVKPTARFELGKNKALPKLRIGSTVEITIRGRVTNLNDDEWSRSFSMTIAAIEADGGMGSDLDDMRGSRRY